MTPSTGVKINGLVEDYCVYHLNLRFVNGSFNSWALIDCSSVVHLTVGETGGGDKGT
jgi:hypothetical protein